jgi:hypothetical protein
MGFALHPYRFVRTMHEQAAEIQVGQDIHVKVAIGEVYEELFPKPGKGPRRLTVTSILPPSNENSGTARIGGTTAREYDLLDEKGSTSIMAYTLHSHWKKVD